MADSAFHEKTKAAKPQMPCNPTTYWAAVLLSEKKPEGPTVEEDYLWIKCHQKITVDIVREQYSKRNGGEDIFLRHNGSMPEGCIPMKDLDTYDDHVIAFEAIKKPELASRLSTHSPRLPLQPSGRNVLQEKVIPQADIDVLASGSKSPYDKYRDSSNLQSFAHPKLCKSPLPTQDENLVSATTRASTPPGVPQNLPSKSSRSSRSARSVSPRPDANIQALDPAFTKYLQSYRIEYFHHWSPSSGTSPDDADVQSEAWKNWVSLSPQQQAPYYQAARQSLALGSTEMARTPVVSNPCMATHHLSARSTPEQLMAGTSNQVKHEEKITELDFQDQFCHDNEPAQSQSQSQSFQLQNFIADASLEILEASVEKGVEFLQELKRPLADKSGEFPDAAQWVQQIGRLQRQAIKTKTVIGVVGNTGAGKSSVINAMLDEERLVPTNTMRACTAVVTELSYNYENAAYRAEIEFISAADWNKELHILFRDLIDDNGNISRECTSDPDSDAGIAYAKIKAVYPKKTREDICNSSIEKMLQEVSHILGKTRDIKEDNSSIFYKHLQRYVDSKEKATGKKDKNEKKEPKEIEFWPLIKVVRIFVKSPALSTGAVIVDLPGVHDANAARAAVAEGYMKQCTGLWIVAPIIRAVDDKAAKNLLGESFKRQLKMDGGFSFVTFICSKTDDISLSEASDSLGLDDENGPLWEEMDQHAKKQTQLKKDLKELKETKATYIEAGEDVDHQLEIWEALRDKLDSGSTVYPPKMDKKRKRAGSKGSRKKQKRSSDDDEDDDYNDEKSTDEGEEEYHTSEDERNPLTEEQIVSKINELRGTKREARRQRTELEDRMKRSRLEMAEAQEAEKKIESQISKVCIEGRNAYSKGAIQQDFAAGMKELDQELAVEEDEENFDPDEDLRDYDELARSLPVFCVSSRGYQKLQGRLKKDPPVPGFQTLDETEIPQLQAHCKELTVAGRTATCKRFITNLSQLLNSLTLWASTDQTGAKLTVEQRAKENKFLNKSLANLETDLEELITTVINQLKEELGDNIFDKYDTAISHAISEATKTCHDWGRPVNRENREAGGLHWASYKAVCRRYGVYSNAQGPHDWNTALAEPMIKVIAGGWDRTFSRRTPTVLSGLPRSAHNLLRAFHKEIEQKTGAILPGLHVLQQQLQVYEQVFQDLEDTTKKELNSRQKDINREFVPVIQTAMTEAYDICEAERGTGSYNRMKAALNGHVDTIRHEMFSDSCDEVRTKLKGMLVHVEELMAKRADELFAAISRDYRSVLGGSNAPRGDMMPRSQRIMRKEVKSVIGRAEKIFKRVAGIEVEDDDDDGSNADTEHDGDLPEGAATEDEEATPSTLFDHHDIKMDGDDEASIRNASPAGEDGSDNLATEPERTPGSEDVEMPKTEPAKPRNASRPRDSGVGTTSSEHTSDSSAESTPDSELGVDPKSDSES
ncbi:hypothetical protein MMC30_005824 [Trapelia coarctata]|nr:hypothetical protein [Trapelia coarctata]